MKDKLTDEEKQRRNKLFQCFELLKDEYLEHWAAGEQPGDSVFETISSMLIVPMLKLDIDRGIEMWEYMLQTYYGICDKYAFSFNVVNDVFEEVGTDVMCEIYSKSEVVRKYLLHDLYEDAADYAEDAIEQLLKDGEYKIADEMMWLVYFGEKSHSDKQKNLPEVLDYLVDDIFDEEDCLDIIPFVRKWCEKVIDKHTRICLELEMEKCIDENEVDEDDIEDFPDIKTDYYSKWDFDGKNARKDEPARRRSDDEEDDDDEYDEDDAEEDDEYDEEDEYDEDDDEDDDDDCDRRIGTTLEDDPDYIEEYMEIDEIFEEDY